MKNIILGLFSLILFTSCEQPKEKKDIIASFPPNHLDYNIPPKCGENDAYYNNDSEIVLIKAEKFNSMINRLENLKPSKESNACSSDFSFFVGKDKYCSCIYEERLITRNGKLYEISDTLLFDLKTALTYYNSRTKEDLKYDPLIQKFGLPKNYMFKRSGEILTTYDEKGNEEVSIIEYKNRIITLSTKPN